MLITLQEIMALAQEKKCAIGSFNTPNLESLQAVLDAAEKYNVPVIISHAQVHEGAMPLVEIGPMMVEVAKKAKVPVSCIWITAKAWNICRRRWKSALPGSCMTAACCPTKKM